MIYYNILRSFHPDSGKPSKLIKRGLTLDEAQAHCKDPRTRNEGVWFDFYALAN